MLADLRDLAALRRSMEITRQLGNSEAMKPFVKREILPGPVEGEALDNLIRDGAMSMHHPTCTAKRAGTTSRSLTRSCGSTA